MTRLRSSLFFFFTLFHFIQRQRMCDFTREEGRGGACSCNYDYEGGTSQSFGLPPRQLMSPYLPLWFSPFGQKRRQRRRRRRRNVYHVRFCASDDPAGHWREKGCLARLRPTNDRLQREHRLAPQFSDWLRPSIQCAGEVQYLMEVHQVCNQPIMPYWRALWRTALAMIDDTATECLKSAHIDSTDKPLHDKDSDGCQLASPIIACLSSETATSA